MAEDLASLGIRLDSSGVSQGTQSLDALADAAERAEGATQGLQQSFEETGKSGANAAGALEEAARGLREVGGAATEIPATASALSRSAGAARELGSAASSAKAELSGFGSGAAKGLNDVATSAENAASSVSWVEETIAKVHAEAERLRKTTAGVAEAHDDLADSVDGTSVSLGGLNLRYLAIAAGVGAVVASIATLTKAYVQGRSEAFEFNKALVLNNNASGATVGMLNEQAKAIDRVAGTQAEAARVLTELAASGKVSAERLQEAATLALQLEKSAGIASGETIKAFIELGRRPVEAVKKLNEQYNFLTASTYEQIRALSEQGREWEAADLAQRTFSEQMGPRVAQIEERLGSLQRAARATGGFFKEMWDGILGIGREETPEERLADLERQIANRQMFFGRSRDSSSRERAAAEDLQNEAALLRIAIGLQEDAAKAAAEAAREEQRLIEEADKKAEEARKQRLAAEREAEAIRKAQFGIRLADIQRGLRAETDAYANQGRVLEAQFSAGQVGAAAYYSERKRLIEETADAQIRALEAENIALRESNGSQLERLQNLERVKDNEAEIARIRAGMATEVEALGIAENARLEAITKGYDEARAAAESFLATQQRAWQRELDGMGQGRLARERDAGRNAIDDRYERQRQQIESDRRTAPDTQENRERFTEALRLVDEYHAKELAAYTAHWAELREGETDWRIGVSEAVNNYLDESTNFAKITEGVVTDSLASAETAVARFVRTGKLSFRDLTSSILADLAKLGTSRLFTTLLGAFTPLGEVQGAGTRIVPNANGNVYAAPALSAYSGQIVNQPTLFAFAKGAGVMGEAGAEGILPLKRDSSGQLGVIAMGGGGGEVNVHIHGAPSTPTVNKRRNASGGFDIDVVFKEMENWMADRFASGASPFNSVMRGRYGLEAT